MWNYKVFNSILHNLLKHRYSIQEFYSLISKSKCVIIWRVQVPEVVELSGAVIVSFYKDVGAQDKLLGGAKNVTCSFCDASFYSWEKCS